MIKNSYKINACEGNFFFIQLLELPKMINIAL